MNLPQKLQEYRRTEKLSQEDLAARLGVSRQSVSKWEQGLAFPETEKLIELSNMMGVSIDSLLKGEEAVPEDPTPTQESAGQKNWLAIVLACLLAVTSFALVFTIWQNRNDTTPGPGDTLQQGEEDTEMESTSSSENTSESEQTEQENESTESEFENRDLRQLQSWFFDFAREYRLDYMPQFTREEGAPTDAGAYLDWAFAINLDNWGEDKGKMSRSYVEETVLMYYAVIPQQHRSHRKSWDYDADTETYTAYPESLKELGYYLLNSIEVDQGYYTVHATRYYSRNYGYSQEEEDALRTALFEGTNTELIPVSELTVTFRLDHVFNRPVFHAYTEEFLTSDIS